MKEETIVSYELPDVENHSFFFVNACIGPDMEAKLHRHDAWELCYITHGYGRRMAGDTLQPFSADDVALIPPSMLHHWEFAADSADGDGNIRYLMVAFGHSFVKRCMDTFPEIRNGLAGLAFSADALKFGGESSRIIRRTLLNMNEMDEVGRLCEMLRLLPVIFASSDCTLAGKPLRIERDVRRMHRVCIYVMRHYAQAVSLDDVAAEAGLNRFAFCSYFKRCKGMTFFEYLSAYRIATACGMLADERLSIAEICYAVGFNDVPHFNRVFKKLKGVPPGEYRKRKCGALNACGSEAAE